MLYETNICRYQWHPKDNKYNHSKRGQLNALVLQLNDIYGKGSYIGIHHINFVLWDNMAIDHIDF